MTQNTQIENITLSCGEDGCSFARLIRNAAFLNQEEAELLNSWLDPAFTPTTEQVDMLQKLIIDGTECPVHGRKNLGYICTWSITANASFVIKPDGNVVPFELDGDEDGFIFEF